MTAGGAAQPPVPRAIAAPVVVASPPVARGVAALPRLRGLADTAVQARVNGLLARRDRALRAERRECEASAREGARARGSDVLGYDFTQTLRGTYVSARFLSVDAHVSYYCGGPYPENDSPRALTLNLATGREVNWARAVPLGPRATDALWRAYVARYRRVRADSADADADDGCPNDVASWTGTGVVFWIARDARGRPALGVLPDLPHVIEACAEPILLPAAAARPLVVDVALRAELGG